MVVNRSIPVAAKVKIRVIGKIDDRCHVRCCRIANGQDARISRETESDDDANVAWITFVSIGTQETQRERRCQDKGEIEE